MTDVSIRDLRNKGGEIVDRAEAGEPITITRDGRPVARLTAIKPWLTTAQVIERLKNLPPMDPDALRRDIDSLFDQSW
jgi:prevent-host-death family protein